MPTYEYKCNECGKVFEVFQSMTDKPIKKCSDKKCKGTVKRLIGGGAGFIFKGAGFYATDYRSKDYKKSEREEKKSVSSQCKSCSGKDGCPAKQ